MISRKTYLMGRDVEFPPTKSMLAAADDLLERVDSLFKSLGIEILDEDQSSGYRPGHYNTDAHGSEHSAHKECQAIDIKDPCHSICNILASNPHILVEHGLWMENPKNTPGWAHLQSRPTHNRIFTP